MLMAMIYLKTSQFYHEVIGNSKQVNIYRRILTLRTLNSLLAMVNIDQMCTMPLLEDLAHFGALKWEGALNVALLVVLL